jgi:cytochrome c peroxidase
VALGRKLFFDRRLSADETVSCASCHILREGGDDNAPVSTGIEGRRGTRNAPTVWNAAFLKRLFWDGRAGSLEDQARGPLTNPLEMGMPSYEAVERRVASITDYRTDFSRAFADEMPVTMANIAKAIAAYERTLITPETAYDRFVRGDDQALTEQQQRGMALFAETGCRSCHVDPTFSSAGTIRPFGIFRPFPVYAGNPLVEKYALLADGKPAAYRVPSLRNVAQTAPYFHNGAVASLQEAIRIMAVSQLGKVLSDDERDDMRVTPQRGDTLRLSVDHRRALSTQEIEDIAAFLATLSAAGPAS